MTTFCGLAGKSVLVTGAASGIGRAVALACVRQGMRVAGIDINTDGLCDVAREAQAEAVEWISFPTDVSDSASVDAAFDATCDRFGKLDCFVHCAAIGGRHAAVDYPMTLWDDIMRINAGGAFLCSLAAARAIERTAGRGAMVLTSSIVGLIGITGSVGYQVSKAIDVQLARSLAVELAPRSIRVNSIAPGYFETPATDEEAKLEPEYYSAFVELIPQGRPGRTSDAVGAVLFLLSDAADHISGQILPIDGATTARSFRL